VLARVVWRRKVAVILAIAGLMSTGLAGAAVAQQSAPDTKLASEAQPPLDHTALNSIPNAISIQRYYPHTAFPPVASGRVILRCRVSESATLVNCGVEAESPSGLGYGNATLRIARAFTVRPTTDDGVSTVGREISFPVRWVPGAPLPPPHTPGPSKATRKTIPYNASSFSTVPTASVFAQLYPRHARNNRIVGQVRLRCDVGQGGLLINCDALSEDPPRMGFGDATLRLTRHFKVREIGEDGQSTLGGTITFPVRWRFGQ